MKKILFPLISSLAFVVLLGGCKDFNDQFDGLDDATKPTNLTKYSYQLVDADYTTISKAAKKIASNAADSALADAIGKNKYLTPSTPSKLYIPLLLATKYPYGDVGTTASITYAYGDCSTDLNSLSVLTDDDYQSIWGDHILYVSAFTPAKSPSTNLSAVLKTKFPTAKSGTYKFVEYNYSETEATSGVVDFKYFYDDFETHTCATSSPYTPIGENGWLNKDITGSVKWVCKLFSSNKYAQASSNKSSAKNDIYLITKQIDLRYAIAPKFTFDINVGYWNADCLTVLISENFDGNEANINAATWIDISSNFTFPTDPTDAYGTLANAGEADLTSYIGKKVYIAYKYSGDDSSTPKKTTTYQIDNVKVSEMRTALSIPSSEKQYVVYKFNGSTWALPTSTDPTYIALQPADYEAIGLSNLTTTNAFLYLPKLLSEKFPYSLVKEGDVKNVVYKTGITSTSASATTFTYTKGVWSSTKTDPFAFSSEGWIFDPTVILDMITADYKIMVDYVLATPEISMFAEPSYKNEEFYFGFSSRYSNVSFRLSGYRSPYYFPGKTYQQPETIDAELSSLTNDADRSTLLWNRLKKGMGIFLTLRYPDAVPTLNGVDVYYKVNVKVYYPDCVTNVTNIYCYKFKCTAAGAPPTFEFVSVDKI